MNDSANRKVSIVTPCFNSSATINETYESICAQEHPNWEWLVTDDNSSDSTLTILQGFAAYDPRVRVFQNQRNRGAGATRNTSIGNASGEYIAFLDADDLWKPKKLSRQLKFMEDNKIAFCFTPFEVMDDAGVTNGKVIDKGAPQTLAYKDLLFKKATLGCSTVMIDQRQVIDVKMPKQRTGQDYVTWLSILKRGTRAHLFSESLTYYRIRPGSLSRNKLKKAQEQWRIYREVEGLSMYYSFFCFCSYSYRALVRR